MGGEGAASCWPCADVGYWNGGHGRTATTVSVEHRFYGRSVPNGGLTAANLPFLTTPHNLRDTAAVVQAVNPGGARRVLNFGGSYSGGTAAWFRTKFPELTHAAVSSSGVVDAIVDFVQFDESIVATLGDYSRRSGSAFPNCLNTVVAAINALDEMSAAQLRAAKTYPFNASVGQTDVDFMYMIADAIAMAVQYGGKQHLCTVLQNQMSNQSRGNGGDGAVAAVARAIPILYGPAFQQGCFYDTSCIAKTLRDSATGVGNKAWRWQKCSLLGYIQSRPGGAAGKVAARSRLLTLASQRQQCKDMFPGNGKDLDRLMAANAQFQTEFGGAHPSEVGASKIIFVDYSDDPWQTASVRGTGPEWPERDLHYCFEKCDGCGHCGAGVPKNVTTCADAIAERVGAWLETN